jgi:hypothetical protein
MAYIPKNRVISNLYTPGSTFYIKNTNSDYTGFYYKTSNGKFFSGKNPDDPDSREILEYPPSLDPIDIDTRFLDEDAILPVVNYDVTDFIDDDPFTPRSQALLTASLNGALPYTLLNQTNDPRTQHIIPRNTIVIPSEEDINLGVFDRHFLYRINTKEVIEVNKEVYRVVDNEDQYLGNIYTSFIIPWVIDGKEEDTFNTNLNTVKITQTRNNILDNAIIKFFLNNFSQFHLTYPGVLVYNKNKNLRYYPNSEFIPTPLPKVYQMGNQVSYTSNPNVPEKQNCSNCIFNKNNYCNKWEALIKNTYWCAAYNGEYGKGRLLEAPPSEPVSTPVSTPMQPTYSPPSSPTPSTGGGFSGGGGY